jgi:hypothetical protein
MLILLVHQSLLLQKFQAARDRGRRSQLEALDAADGSERGAAGLRDGFEQLLP